VTNLLLASIERTEFVRRIGRVTQFFGMIVESTGPDVFLGERCDIYSRGHNHVVPAEVVGIRDGKVLLMPYGEIRGIRAGSEVVGRGESISIPVGEGLLGRVINAFGQPLDDRPMAAMASEYPIFARDVNPLTRPPIDTVLETGIRAIDTMLTIGVGQRVGIFAGSGVGKSTLLGMIARNVQADVAVIALVGERSREVREFVEHVLGAEGLKKSVVVVATSDQPALIRTHAAFTASAIAEYFRDQGKNVVLVMDSVTRFAMAQRAIGLAVGEPPTARGYTPSVFALLPRLLERAGTVAGGGSITGLYTVLVEGDDLQDPVSDSVRAILDGHIVLSRELANHRHYPSIDLLHSNSRLISRLQNKEQKDVTDRAMRAVSTYEKSRDMIDIGAYRSGSNVALDKVIKLMPDMNKVLTQAANEHCPQGVAFRQLSDALQKHGL
jgi:flagellum-specific ATP synthase